MSTKKLKMLARGYSATRERRLAMQKDVDAKHATEKSYRDDLLALLQKKEQQGITVDFYNYIEKETEEPTLKNPAKLFKHIKKTGEFDLLQRRLNTTAIKQRWEEGKKVPGVKKFPVKTLSVTKV